MVSSELSIAGNEAKPQFLSDVANLFHPRALRAIWPTGQRRTYLLIPYF